MEMRQVFAEELAKMMEQDEDICVINADLAKACGLTELSKRFKDRVLNVGVAEQNMASMAAGLAAYGFTPIINTFTPFATRRICDQIAISISYAKSNVKIVGLDPGISAQLNGGTHMSVEDIGVLRSIPDLMIFEPVDAVQLRKALPQIMSYKGPVYMRLFRLVAHPVFKETDPFELTKAHILREGKDVSIFASGIMVREAMEAADELIKQGIDAEIINLHTIKPIDTHAIVQSVQKTKAAVTAENHNVIGGLGSAVCEVLGKCYAVPVEMVGIQDTFGEVGMMDYLSKRFGLKSHNIIEAVQEVMKRKKEGESNEVIHRFG
jgi:transketolase